MTAALSQINEACGAQAAADSLEGQWEGQDGALGWRDGGSTNGAIPGGQDANWSDS